MSNKLENTIQLTINAINQLINRQLNVVLHHPKFQRLEASWRGVALLTEQAANDKQIIIRVLSLRMAELSKDILGAIEFDQTELFKKIYSEEFDQPGGQPYNLLIGDYYFSHLPQKDCRDSIRTLSEISKIAAAAFTPFITGAGPETLGINQFTELQIPFKIKDIMQHQAYKRWHQLRKEQTCRFIALTLPRILIRKPYQPYDTKYRHLFFEEEKSTHEHYLWANACYAYASAALNSFKNTGWFMSMRGIDSDKQTGALTKHLARDYFTHSGINNFAKISTEYRITEHQEQLLAENGFLTLHDNPLLETAIFYTSQSLHKPVSNYNSNTLDEYEIASQIHYLLCACRFAHYIKVIIRDKVGSFISAEECQRFITSWLHGYCASSQEISIEAKARYPLQQAQVEISEDRTSPGKYQCQLQLKPHYQFDDIQTHLKLVTQVQLS